MNDKPDSVSTLPHLPMQVNRIEYLASTLGYAWNLGIMTKILDDTKLEVSYELCAVH